MNQGNKVSNFSMLLLGGVCVVLASLSATAADDTENLDISRELTTIYRSARAVISENQAHINDPAIGDKGLSGEVIVAKMKQKYKTAMGRDFALADSATLMGTAQAALLASIDETMVEAQPLINEKGKGFKAFLPAIFARSMGVKFTQKMDGKMGIKLTAPKAYVRNRRNRPDSWESNVIESKFKSPGYVTGKAYAENAELNGAMVYRYILPEYYGESCLGCHGKPAGERDITGGKKEGGILGELGGAVSIFIQ